MSFEKDIALRPGEQQPDSENNPIRRFEANITHDWFIIAGPNGGFIAALLLHAMRAIQTDPARLARSLTIDYFSPPQTGAAYIDTHIIRQGRNLTFIEAKMHQDNKLRARAVASFSKSYEGLITLESTTKPEALPFDESPIMPTILPIHDQYEMRPAFGTLPFSGGDRAISGGWTTLKQPPSAFNAEMLAAISDCWPPSVFSVMDQEQFGQSGGMPTIELSVYFIQPEIYPQLNPKDPVLARFEAREIYHGFLTEDGEIWSQQGALLAHVRQIAIAR